MLAVWKLPKHRGGCSSIPTKHHMGLCNDDNEVAQASIIASLKVRMSTSKYCFSKFIE